MKKTSQKNLCINIYEIMCLTTHILVTILFKTLKWKKIKKWYALMLFLRIVVLEEKMLTNMLKTLYNTVEAM